MKMIMTPFASCKILPLLLDQIAPAFQSDLLGALKRMGPAPYDAMLHIVFNEIAGRASRSFLPWTIFT